MEMSIPLKEDRAVPASETRSVLGSPPKAVVEAALYITGVGVLYNMRFILLGTGMHTGNLP